MNKPNKDLPLDPYEIDGYSEPPTWPYILGLMIIAVGIAVGIHALITLVF